MICCICGKYRIYKSYFGPEDWCCPHCGELSSAEVSKSMAESPNDSDYTKELRTMLNNVREIMNATDDTGEQADTELEKECYVARRLLRCWIKATEKDFSSDERYLLNRLTTRLLDGV
jgi:hypothetical protein